MSKSIIISGPHCSGKTTLLNALTSFFKANEVLRLTPGRGSQFMEPVKPNDFIRMVVVDSVNTITEILYQERYLRYKFHLYPSFVGAIYVTQDSEGIINDYADVLSDFFVFNLPEYKALLKAPAYN